MLKRWWREAGQVLTFLVWEIFVPVGFVLGLILLAPGIMPSIHAARGEGQPGIFTAQHQQCSKSCTWTGEFVSNDGSLVFHDAFLGTDTPKRPGDKLAVLYEGETDPPGVYLAHGSWEWLQTLLVVAGLAGYLCWWVVTRGLTLIEMYQARHYGRRRFPRSRDDHFPEHRL